jgi:putative transposase
LTVEANGCAERFIRTLTEQLLWIERLDIVEALRQALLASKDRYNTGWLIERHGQQSPGPSGPRSLPTPQPDGYQSAVQEFRSGSVG